MNNTNNRQTHSLVLLALFGAMVAVLQVIAYSIKIGVFNLSLVCIPLVLGGIILGRRAGAALGGIFGIVVLVGCISGTDIGGQMLLSVNPFATIVLCLIKGIAAGFAAALLYSLVFKASKNQFVSSIVASAACPIVNTLLFCKAMLTIFRPTLIEWAGGKPVFEYIFLALIGWNFLFEFLTTVIIVPPVYHILSKANLKL